MLTSLRTFRRIYGKVLALLAAMVAGSLLPQLHGLSFLIQYLLMAMLFFAFLDIEFQRRSFQWGLLWILLANLAIAFVSYEALAAFDHTLALAAFLTAVAPTAIASPVIVSLIGGQVEYVVGAILLTNVAMAFVVPVALPSLLGKAARVSIWQMLEPVLLTVFVPLILARLARLLPPVPKTAVWKGKDYTFVLWVLNLFITCAKAVDFLRNGAGGSIGLLPKIALISLVICALNFSVGALIGGRKFWQEGSQALGQKNNSFVIWVALTFINPLAAMGPTFYVLYHNLYNSFQIYVSEKRRNIIRAPND